MRWILMVLCSFPLYSGSLWLSAVAHGPGSKGTFWQTDLWIINLESTEQTLTLRFLESGLDKSQANINRDPVTITLAPSSQTYVSDVLATLFEVEAGAGALMVEGEGSIQLSSRTYTPNSNTEQGGSFGLYIGPVDSTSLTSVFYLPGAQSSENFRTNMGFANTSPTEASTCTLTFYDKEGNVEKTASISLEPFVHVQYNDFFSYFNISPQKGLTVKGECNPPTVIGYFTTIDNTSGDPVYAGGMP